MTEVKGVVSGTSSRVVRSALAAWKVEIEMIRVTYLMSAAGGDMLNVDPGNQHELRYEELRDEWQLQLEQQVPELQRTQIPLQETEQKEYWHPWSLRTPRRFPVAAHPRHLRTPIAPLGRYQTYLALVVVFLDLGRFQTYPEKVALLSNDAMLAKEVLQNNNVRFAMQERTCQTSFSTSREPTRRRSASLQQLAGQEWSSRRRLRLVCKPTRREQIGATSRSDAPCVSSTRPTR